MVKLKVIESTNSDNDKLVVRISPIQMKRMDLKVGDIVKILYHSKKIAARIMPIHIAKYSRQKDLIQLSTIIKNNLNINNGDQVQLEKENTELAQTVSVKIMNKENEKFKLNFIKKFLTNKPVVKGMKITLSNNISFVINDTIPEGTVIVGKMTNVNQSIASRDRKKDKKIKNKLSYNDIGGLNEEIYKVRELVEFPMNNKEIFSKLGIEPPKGILLYGPPGTGKTLIARVIARETDANFIHISGPEIMSKYSGESEAKLREIFEKAKNMAPSIIFLDEIDAIAAKREETRGEMEKRVVSQLLALMDGLEKRGEIVVIGATNIPDSLDPALRRPGRFDREIPISIPDTQGRKEILEIHSRKLPLAENIDLELLAKVSKGFVGADLEALCKEAAIKALHRIIPDLSIEKKSYLKDKKIIVKNCDFNQALQEIQPSIIREVVVEVPDVKWKDVGGLKRIKEKLQKNIEWFFKYPEYFEQNNLSVSRGIMLEGPPGVGKTMLVKALANKIQANFISIKGPELLSKWVGESEKGIRQIFFKAKQAAPCILFFDEIDALVPGRGKDNNQVIDRVVSQFLTELDGIQELVNVVVIGATNRIDIIDNALLRPGRFDLVLNVPMPNLKARYEILNTHTEGLKLDNINLKKIALKTNGLSGADLASICRRASFNALEKTIKDNRELTKEDIENIKISYCDFQKSLCDIRKENKIL